MAGKIKVAGYAQKVFYNDGIEYRNFSSNLVGNQLTNSNNSALFTIGNFDITTNLDSKISKIFNTNNFSSFLTLSDLKNGESINLTLNEKKMTLNLNKHKLSNYAYFGSLREYIRVSLENIIIKWPASLFASPLNDDNVLVNENTVEDYVYDDISDISSFKVNVNRLNNNFDINFLKNGETLNSYSEGNDLRNLTVNYSSYVIVYNGVSVPVVDFTGSNSNINDYIEVKVKGNLFNGLTNFKINYHIRPNDSLIEKFFIELSDFENNVLNRFSSPIYTSSYNFNYEADSGNIILGSKTITWPISDGYNIDFQSESYVNFVSQLIEMSDNSDLTSTNLVNRFFVSESISEFDTLPNLNFDDLTSGQKVNSTLKIYGREFDEVKKYIDGIGFANVVTYDGNDNVPNLLIKNLAKVLGWDLISSILEVDLLKNYLSVGDSTYVGHSRGLSPVEKEVELYRRLIMNTPWLWKSKGTRKSIEFLFKFIGTPDGLISFNEYIYVANNSLDMNSFRTILSESNGTDNLQDLNVDDDGFPVVNRNNSEMYFQKAGLWYRETGGVNSNVDILVGNNPHIGPYDGGQEYMNQFNCLIPDFEPVTLISEKTRDETTNLFINYDNGTFDSIYDSNIVSNIDLNVNFSGIVNTQIVESLQGYEIQPELSGCSGTTTWVLDCYLDNELVTSSTLLGGDSLLNGVLVNYNNLASQYLGALNVFYNELNSNYAPITSEVSNLSYSLVEESGQCEVYTPYYLGKVIRVELKLNLDYSCNDCKPVISVEPTFICPVSEMINGVLYFYCGLVTFSGLVDNILIDSECCTNLGYQVKAVQGGFNCYATIGSLQ